MEAIAAGNNRFRRGNPGGPGNPITRQTNQLRVALARHVTPPVLRTILRKLVTRAKAGDVGAARVLFDRVFGAG